MFPIQRGAKCKILKQIIPCFYTRTINIKYNHWMISWVENTLFKKKVPEKKTKQKLGRREMMGIFLKLRHKVIERQTRLEVLYRIPPASEYYFCPFAIHKST